MYIVLNHWIATDTTGSYYLKNRLTGGESNNLHIICSKCLPPARTQASRLRRQVANGIFYEQICPLVLDASFQFVDIWDLGTHWRRTFRACSGATYYTSDDLRDNNCRRVCGYSVPCLRLNLSLQVSQGSANTYILGEVGTICIVLLSVYYRTCLPFFYWNRTFDRQIQKTAGCWQFFSDMV